jgi:hypothetical protein
VARGDPVDGIGVVRNADAALGQLVTKAYRPRTGDRRGLGQRTEALGEFLRFVDRRLPDPGAVACVEGGENLPPPAVEDRQPLAGGARLADPGRDRVQGAYPAQRQAEAGAEAAPGRDPDPQAGEGAGTDADGDQVDRFPAAGGLGRMLDLAQQPGRVPGSTGRGEPQLRLVQNLAVAPGAGDGVDRRGVEADDDQGCATP